MPNTDNALNTKKNIVDKKLVEKGTHAITRLWDALGDEGSFLGKPVSEIKPTFDTNGLYQEFQNGAIYWSETTGAQYTFAGIYGAWRALGAEQSPLGLPIGHHSPVNADGVSHQDFVGGAFYWFPEGGEYIIYREILDKWREQGAENGLLGRPLHKETIRILKGWAQYQFFVGGAIYWARGIGAYYTRGGIMEHWRSLGAEDGPLGFPIADHSIPDKHGSHQHFQNGSIYWTDKGATVFKCKTCDP